MQCAEVGVMPESRTVADYEDAVRRIVSGNVDPESTTREEVMKDLVDVNDPQVTREVAEGIVENVLTEDRVIEAIESTGELPTEGEIEAIVNVSDDYNMHTRQASVSRQIRQNLATVEDVQQAVRERQVSGRPTFREEVETAVQQVSESKRFVGESPEQVTQEQALEVGAPREADFRREAAQTVARSEQVTPAEVLEGTSAKTPVQVIRDSSGEAVAATGGPSAETGSRVADHLGVEYLTTEQVVQEMSTEGSGETVSLTLRGRAVGEVSVA